MTGRIYAVVGPSGAGKDTLMAALKDRRPDLCFVRRVITRPTEAGGEDFDGITEDLFAARAARGDFALSWQAHGLSYGIPAAVNALLDEGRDVLFNGSRAILPKARQVFPALRVIHVTAPIPVLAERLEKRGRETRAQIAKRLERAVYQMPGDLPVTVICNDGSVGQAVEALEAALQPESV